MSPNPERAGSSNEPSDYCDIVEEEEEYPTKEHSPSPHHTAVLRAVTMQNVRQLKLINQSVFPVAYSDGFYKQAAASGDLARLAYLGDAVAGGVVCQTEERDSEKVLYITTLGVLPSYRRRGIGKLLLEHAIAMCRTKPEIKRLLLHVQASNEAALAFYASFGFRQLKRVENYYPRTEHPDAFVLEKTFDAELSQ